METVKELFSFLNNPSDQVIDTCVKYIAEYSNDANVLEQIQEDSKALNNLFNLLLTTPKANQERIIDTLKSLVNFCSSDKVLKTLDASTIQIIIDFLNDPKSWNSEIRELACMMLVNVSRVIEHMNVSEDLLKALVAKIESFISVRYQSIYSDILTNLLQDSRVLPLFNDKDWIKLIFKVIFSQKDVSMYRLLKNILFNLDIHDLILNLKYHKILLDQFKYIDEIYVRNYPFANF
jgi:hypothetical protein